MAAFSDLPDALTVKQIQTIVKTNSVCMFATNLSILPVQTRPMNTQYADNNGALWFFSDKDSVKNEAIRTDPRVQLFYVDPFKEQFVSIYGQAQILFDREKIEEFWSAFASSWFTGKDDPQISLIKVAPENIINWNEASHKMAVVLPREDVQKEISKKAMDKDLTELEQLE